MTNPNSSNQLTLFKPQLCDWCHKDPGADPRNGYLWNGIRDMVNGLRICFKCRTDYYKNKKVKPVK